jgi:hypothetical protein
MNSPFIFGRIAEGNCFIDRKKESKLLVNNILSSVHTMITGPAGWGKSSLVHRAAEQIANKYKRTKFCHISLMNMKNESHFFDIFSRELTRFGSVKWPQVTDRDTILELPEKISRKQRIRLVVCIDHFQKIGELKDDHPLPGKLSTRWLEQKNVCYCLTGNRRDLIGHQFAGETGPFYNFADLIYLQKIKSKQWYGFIEEGFTSTGKSISSETIDGILDVTGGSPYFIQQLAHCLWRITERHADPEILESCLEEVLLHNEIHYRRELENLTPLQARYLAALVNGEKQPTSMMTIQEYRLGSPGNMSTIKSALASRGVIDFYGAEPVFTNPLFEYWLKHILKLGPGSI